MLNGFTNSLLLALPTEFIPIISKKLLLCHFFSNSFLLCVPIGGSCKKSPIRVQDELTRPIAKNIGSNGAMLISSMNSASYCCACKSVDIYVIDSVAPITAASSITCLRTAAISRSNSLICCSIASIFLASSLISFSRVDTVSPTVESADSIADASDSIIFSKSAISKERAGCLLCSNLMAFRLSSQEFSTL